MPAWVIFLLSVALSVPAAATIVRGRERTRLQQARAFEHELASELLAQASGLDRLVAVLGGLADSLDGDRVLVQAATEARRLLDADEAVLLRSMADGVLRARDREDLYTLEVADPDRALGAFRHGRPEGRCRRRDQLRRRRERSVRLEQHAQHDFEAAAVGRAHRRIPTHGQGLAQRIDLVLRELSRVAVGFAERRVRCLADQG